MGFLWIAITLTIFHVSWLFTWMWVSFGSEAQLHASVKRRVGDGSGDPSRATAGPGKTFSRIPYGEEIFDFFWMTRSGVLYISERRWGSQKRRGARGNLPPLPYASYRRAWVADCYVTDSWNFRGAATHQHIDRFSQCSTDWNQVWMAHVSFNKDSRT